MDTRTPLCIHDRRHILAAYETYCFFAKLSENHFWHTLCLCYRKITYTALMALDEIPQVCITDAVAQPCTTLEQYIFPLPPLPSMKKSRKVE